jgi:hypothetical protein
MGIVTMKLPERGDGPQQDAGTSRRAVVKTTEVASPDPTGDSNLITSRHTTIRQSAWTRLWDQLLAEPRKAA